MTASEIALPSGSDTEPSVQAPTPSRVWAKTLAVYVEPSTTRSIIELGVTAAPFVASWVLAWISLRYVGYWLSLPFVVASAGFLVRLFMIQHDCGHGSFFRHRVMNDWSGRLIGILTMTPYGFWRRTHAAHHATSGNLDRRGMGDIDTLTVSEYLSLSRWGRIRYQLYRHPAVMFGLGPAYLFLLQHRLPVGMMRSGWRPWLSTMANNAAILLSASGLIWLIGVGPFLLVHLPTMVLAASAGVWLFYVQHQFDETFWARDGAWRFHDAALHGSSHYVLPPVLRWLTANIGVHHVHHLNCRIPFYRLGKVLRDHPELASMGRVTLWQSLRCVRLTLWDEAAARMISFRDLHRRLRQSRA